MKKIISSILVICIILSSFGAFAYDYPPEYKYEDDLFRFDVGEFAESGKKDNEDKLTVEMKNIQLLSALGIWDNEAIAGNALLTKTEFSVIMSNFKLGADNALKSVYLYEKNADTQKATYKDAYVYLVETLGYSYRLTEFNNSEQALVIVASDIGLLSDKPENINSYISRNGLAELLVKALNVDMCVMEHTSLGGYKYTVAEGKTIGNSVHGVYDFSGFMNAIPGLAVYGGAGLKEGFVEINRNRISTNWLDAEKYFGRTVKAYATYDEDKDKYDLLYIEENADIPVLEIDFKDIIEVKDNEIIYIDESGEENNIECEFMHIAENGIKLEQLSDMSNPQTCEGKLVLTSDNKNNDFNIAVIYKYDYFVVDYVDLYKNSIGFKFGMTYNGSTSVQIDLKAVNKYTLDGEVVELSKIPVDSIMRMLRCDDTGYLEIVAVKNKPSGVVATVYEDTIELGGKSYRLSKNLTNRIGECVNDDNIAYEDKILTPAPGDNIILYAFDNIVVGYTAGSEYMYAYLKSAELTRTSIEPEMTIRVYTQNSRWLDISFADKVILDGTSGVSKTNVSDYLKNNFDTVFDELIRIKLNESDECIFIDTIIQSSAESETSDDLCFVEDYENGVYTVTIDWTKWAIEGSRYLFDEAAPIFMIPENKDKEDRFKILKPSELTGGEDYELVLYNPDKFLHLGAILYRGELEAGSGASAYRFYVENISRAVIDADNQEYGYKIKGTRFVDQGGKANGICEPASYYISDEVYDEKVKSGNENKILVGDLLKIYVSRESIVDWTPSDGFERGTGKITMGQSYVDLGMINYNPASVMAGYIEAVDVSRKLILINCGADGYWTVSPRARAVIDTVSKKATNLNISDFHVGDFVYASASGPHAGVMIKNVD